MNEHLRATQNGIAEPCNCDTIPHDRREHIASPATGDSRPEPDPLGLGRAVADYEATATALAEAVRYVATRGVSDPDVSHAPDDVDREYAAALLSAMGRPTLRTAEPCRYCGSVNGETPLSAVSWDPLTGESIRGAIAEACSLTNPRLSEVEWDDVAGLLPPVVNCVHPEGAMTSNEDVIFCIRCGQRWPNRGDSRQSEGLPGEVIRAYLDQAEAFIEAAAERSCRDHFKERHQVLTPPCGEALAEARWWFEALHPMPAATPSQEDETPEGEPNV